ncbi:MAG: FAD-dependent oxidoreductase [Candidatus Omnitrophota bacterium]|jgi:NADPH-dependent glutamate synthase beta subunit-like oxidoreductase|nr:MAG: FAD-dependent oxidoreductase [Candidatus Omnitrophota bacterium]
MAKVVKKAKKKLGTGGFSSQSKGKVVSDLRPEFVPKTPPCMAACPNNTNIREIVTTIAQAEKKGISHEESFQKAWDLLLEKNPLPAVCGRVCPHPCETDCNRTHKDGAVSINNIERFVGDWAIEKDLKVKKLTDETRSEKIAIVGAGPAGLSCAYQLARQGYPVTIFEAFPKAGGMLRYGIPEYRLPRDILDKEIDRIVDLGVDLKCNTSIGRDMTMDDLRKEYSVIFVGIGAHKGLALNIPGEDAPNVYTGAGFLHRVNTGEKIEVGDKVIVIGGGDSAIDAARVSKRLGADVTILYRRTVKEMPAIEHEITEAQKENIKMEFLAAPIEFMMDGNGRASGMKCIRMELKEADSSGRPRPVPIEGSEFEVPATTVIAAISQEPDFAGFENLREGRDWIRTDEHGLTKEENIFAGGDALALGLVTMAIHHGRRAAELIHCNLRGITPEPELKLPIITHDKMKLDFYEAKERHETRAAPPEERMKNPWGEVQAGLTQEEAIEEAIRCMSCASCFDCGTCWKFCQDNAIVKPMFPLEPYKFKMEFCQGCKKCAEECPCGYIEMH